MGCGLDVASAPRWPASGREKQGDARGRNHWPPELHRYGVIAPDQRAAGMHWTGMAAYTLPRLRGDSEAEALRMIGEMRRTTFQGIRRHRTYL